jgi:hypothetical protein
LKKWSRLMRSRCCPCVCVCVSPPIDARQRLGKNPHNFLCILWDHLALGMSACVCPHNCFVFSAVHVVSKESRQKSAKGLRRTWVDGAFYFYLYLFLLKYVELPLCPVS